MKVMIRQQYKRRIKLVFNSALNTRNKIGAINIIVVPVILYGYGAIDWNLEEIQDLEKVTRKHLCMNQMLAKEADIKKI